MVAPEPGGGSRPNKLPSVPKGSARRRLASRTDRRRPRPPKTRLDLGSVPRISPTAPTADDRRGQLGTKPGPGLLTCLRNHGNYLTPGGGINVLSGVSVVIRAVVLNLLVWLPVVSAVMAGCFGCSASSSPPPRPIPAWSTPWGRRRRWLARSLGVLRRCRHHRDRVRIMTALYFLPWKLAASHAWLKRAATVLSPRWSSCSGPRSRARPAAAAPAARAVALFEGVRLLLAGALILAATFALCHRLFPGDLVPEARHTSYQMRRLFEGWAAVYLTLIAVLAVMGSLQKSPSG